MHRQDKTAQAHGAASEVNKGKRQPHKQPKPTHPVAGLAKWFEGKEMDRKRGRRKGKGGNEHYTEAMT